MDVVVHRLSAFTDVPEGGNPAGVVVTDAPLPAARMQDLARDVGYSETAFLVPRAEPGEWDVRYFAPAIEVTFCGHATVAAGVLLGERDGPGRHLFYTPAGAVVVDVAVDRGTAVAALTSVEPSHEDAPEGLVAAALRALGWSRDDLDPRLGPPAVADAGARHLVLGVRDRAVLAGMDYDVDVLLPAMRAHDLTTVVLAHDAGGDTWHVRNPFPTGGVREDPATGAAAAAFGGLLRARGLVDPPVTLLLHQGDDMGRPSRLEVRVPTTGGIVVRGGAVRIPTPGDG